MKAYAYLESGDIIQAGDDVFHNGQWGAIKPEMYGEESFFYHTVRRPLPDYKEPSTMEVLYDANVAICKNCDTMVSMDEDTEPNEVDNAMDCCPFPLYKWAFYQRGIE